MLRQAGEQQRQLISAFIETNPDPEALVPHNCSTIVEQDFPRNIGLDWQWKVFSDQTLFCD
jgi:hypothetical protein